MRFVKTFYMLCQQLFEHIHMGSGFHVPEAPLEPGQLLVERRKRFGWPVHVNHLNVHLLYLFNEDP